MGSKPAGSAKPWRWRAVFVSAGQRRPTERGKRVSQTRADALEARGEASGRLVWTAPGLPQSSLSESAAAMSTQATRGSGDQAARMLGKHGPECPWCVGGGQHHLETAAPAAALVLCTQLLAPATALVLCTQLLAWSASRAERQCHCGSLAPHQPSSKASSKAARGARGSAVQGGSAMALASRLRTVAAHCG